MKQENITLKGYKDSFRKDNGETVVFVRYYVEVNGVRIPLRVSEKSPTLSRMLKEAVMGE